MATFSYNALVMTTEDGLYAVKKVIIQSEEQLAAVKHEIEASQLFHHPNLLRLIDSHIIHVSMRQQPANSVEIWSYIVCLERA